MIQQLDTDNLNVVTLEDPIEVEFPQVTQGQTNERGGLTFAAGLRAILRQDPDVIMVGEMRDAETAQIALQASLTGHLVMSTLHTSNTVETIARVIDLGAEPWIVANAIQAVIAQRLVRRLCHKCSDVMTAPRDYTAGAEDSRVIIRQGQPIRAARGCETCHDTGYIGRMGIFEVLEIDDVLRDLIKERAANREYRKHLATGAGATLREIGLRRVLTGHTTLKEVLRVT
jgi:general secretion pathway protein E/type IV pilus assembly protein PilB